METANPSAVTTSSSKRHYRTSEEKQRIVEETLTAGISVATIARAHGINANQVFHWRKLYHAGLLRNERVRTSGEGAKRVHLLPVTVTAGAEPQAGAMAVSSQSDTAARSADVALLGVIDLTLEKAQVRITGTVDAGVLRVLLECLRR
jgi:transposase